MASKNRGNFRKRRAKNLGLRKDSRLRVDRLYRRGELAAEVPAEVACTTDAGRS